jgi:hypothetical protein
LKIPRLRRVGEEKLSELCLGQLADVIGFVWRKAKSLANNILSTEFY